MERIKNTVDELLRKLEAAKSSSVSADPQAVLKKILTKKECGHIKFNYFKNGSLVLNVDSSSWLYSFNLKKKELFEGIKKEIPQAEKIVFRIGEVE